MLIIAINFRESSNTLDLQLLQASQATSQTPVAGHDGQLVGLGDLVVGVSLEREVPQGFASHLDGFDILRVFVVVAGLGLYKLAPHLPSESPLLALDLGLGNKRNSALWPE